MNKGTVIGKNIAARRTELNLTQEDLAKKLGYKSKSTINKIELGINDITQTKIIAFAEALNTTPSALMGWDEEENARLAQFAKAQYSAQQLSETDKIVAKLGGLGAEDLKRVSAMLDVMFPKEDK